MLFKKKREAKNFRKRTNLSLFKNDVIVYKYKLLK